MSLRSRSTQGTNSQSDKIYICKHKTKPANRDDIRGLIYLLHI